MAPLAAQGEPFAGEDGQEVFIFSARTPGEEGEELHQVNEPAIDPGIPRKEGPLDLGLETMVECQGIDHECIMDRLRSAI